MLSWTKKINILPFCYTGRWERILWDLRSWETFPFNTVRGDDLGRFHFCLNISSLFVVRDVGNGPLEP